MNASGALLFNTVLHEKFAQELTEKGHSKDLFLSFPKHTRACVCKFLCLSFYFKVKVDVLDRHVAFGQ